MADIVAKSFNFGGENTYYPLPILEEGNIAEWSSMEPIYDNSGDFDYVYYGNDIWVAGGSSNNGLYYSKSDIGKMLMVDNLGNPVWTTIINAEEVAY